jgi:hypothetical protein
LRQHKERAVINRDDFLFMLVPQPDRRQQPDRRAVWRGSRRAVDHLPASALSTAATDAVLWTTPSAQAGHTVEKRLLH